MARFALLIAAALLVCAGAARLTPSDVHDISTEGMVSSLMSSTASSFQALVDSASSMLGGKKDKKGCGGPPAYVAIKFIVPPSEGADFEEAWLDLEKDVEKEEKPVVFDLKKTKMDNLMYIGYSEWESMRDLGEHLHSDHFQDFAKFADDHGVRWELELLRDMSKDIEDEQDDLEDWDSYIPGDAGKYIPEDYRPESKDRKHKGKGLEVVESVESVDALERRRHDKKDDADSKGGQQPQQGQDDDWDKNIPEDYRKYVPKEYRPKDKKGKGKGLEAVESVEGVDALERRRRDKKDDADSKGGQQPQQGQDDDWDKNIPEDYRKYVPKEYRPKDKKGKGLEAVEAVDNVDSVDALERRRHDKKDDADSKGGQQPQQGQDDDWDKNIPEDYRKYVPKEYRPKHKDSKDSKGKDSKGKDSKDSKGKGKGKRGHGRRTELSATALAQLAPDATDAQVAQLQSKLMKCKSLFHVVFVYIVSPKVREEFVDRWTDLAEEAIKVPGNRIFSLRKVAADNTKFLGYSTWSSWTDFHEFVHSKSMEKYVDSIADDNVVWFASPLIKIGHQEE